VSENKKKKREEEAIKMCEQTSLTM
jgi:hypothetical protein